MLRLSEEQFAALRRRLKTPASQRIAKTLPTRLKRSSLEAELAWQMDAAGLAYVSEYRFDPVRRWRVDFAFLPQRLAVEIDGGVHRIKDRFERDPEKHNALVLAGWRLLRFSAPMVRGGHALLTIRRAVVAFGEAAGRD